MADKVLDIYFVTSVKDPHIVRERAAGDLVKRLLHTKERPMEVQHDGPYVRIKGTACTIKVPHANIAFMLIEAEPDEPKKAAGK